MQKAVRGVILNEIELRHDLSARPSTSPDLKSEHGKCTLRLEPSTLGFRGTACTVNLHLMRGCEKRFVNVGSKQFIGKGG